MEAKTKSETPGINQISIFLSVIAAVIGVVIVGLGVLIALNLNTPVNDALPESREIFTLDEPYNITVVVVFDEEPPVVRFITPDGNPVDMGDIRYRPGSNFIQYFLPNAKPGVWRMNYDPLSNTDITTPYSVYMGHISIKNFGMLTQRDENRHLPVSFEVSSDETGEFEYELHAVFTASDNSIENEVQLKKGYGMLNEPLSFTVDAGRTLGNGGFMLRLTVSVQHGQASIIDTAWLDLRLSFYP